MLKYKILFRGILFLILVIGGDLTWRAHRIAQQRSSADRFLDAAIKENQNCLRKLSGWRDHLTDIDKDIQVGLKNCRLNATSVEIKNVSKTACIGLAKKLFDTTSKTSTLKNITLNGHDLDADSCANTNTVQFDFETTEAGMSWYQKMVEGARRREMYANSKEEDEQEYPTLGVGTVIARLKRLDNESLFDFTVSLENGQVLIITQEDDLALNNGDSVMVIHENGRNQIRKRISP